MCLSLLTIADSGLTNRSDRTWKLLKVPVPINPISLDPLVKLVWNEISFVQLAGKQNLLTPEVRTHPVLEAHFRIKIMFTAHYCWLLCNVWVVFITSGQFRRCWDRCRGDAEQNGLWTNMYATIFHHFPLCFTHIHVISCNFIYTVLKRKAFKTSHSSKKITAKLLPGFATSSLINTKCCILKENVYLI